MVDASLGYTRKKRKETGSTQSRRRPAPRLVSLALTRPAKPDAEPGGGCRFVANKLECGSIRL